MAQNYLPLAGILAKISHDSRKTRRKTAYYGFISVTGLIPKVFLNTSAKYPGLLYPSS